MNDMIEEAIRNLVKSVTGSSNANDTLKLTQAALNLAHTAATFAHAKTSLSLE